VVLLQKKFKDEGNVVMRGGRKMQKGKEGVYGMCGNTQLFQEVYTRGFLCCLDTLKLRVWKIFPFQYKNGTHKFRSLFL
jgi:hypothetical protein